MIRYVPIKRWVTVRFDEGLRLSDLMKSAGASDFTKKTRASRVSTMGPEVKNAKLVYSEINEEEDWVLFQFTTPATKGYPKDHKYKATDPNRDFKIVSLPSKTYTMEIKILKFFEWLKTTPNEITNKDIEDVLKVADVQVFSDDISQQYQGMNYNLSLFDGSTHPTSIPPTFWDKYHKSDQFLSKHLTGLINSIAFYIPQMRQMLIKDLKEKGII